MNIPNSIKHYLNITFFYGFLCGVFKNHDSKNSTYYNFQTGENKENPNLLAEQVGAVMKHAGAAPFVWPYMLAEDAVYLELFLRNEDPTTYGRPP